MIGSANANFGVGEYTQVIASPSYAIPFWADGRTNDGNIEIFTTLIQVGENEIVGLHEVQSLSAEFSVTGPVPNPVSRGSEAAVRVALKQDSNVRIQLLGADGKINREIINDTFTTGEHQFLIDTYDLPVGNYYLSVFTDFGYKGKLLSVVR